MNKKASVVIFIFFLLIGGVLGFWYFRRSTPAEVGNNSGTQEQSGSGFPVAGGEQRGGNIRNATSTEGSSVSPQGTNPFLAPAVTAGPRLLVDTPVAGATVYTDSRGQATLRFIERATGHVQDLPLNEKLPVKITNTTIPKVIEALWGAQADFLVLQSLSGSFNALNTVFARVDRNPPQATSSQAASLGNINLATVIGRLDGAVLPASVHFAAVSPDKKSYVYLNETEGGATAIVTPADKAKIATSLTTVFSSRITEWIPDWPTANLITFTTRGGSGLPGFMYGVDPRTKAKRLFLKNISGLTARMNTDGRKILYSEGSGSGFLTYLYDVGSGVSSVFQVQTLPEKCIWSRRDTALVYCAVPATYPSGAYPDDWYMGKVRFADALWKINTASGETKVLGEGSDATFDAHKLFLDEKEENLFFISKSDSSVWSIPLGI